MAEMIDREALKAALAQELRENAKRVYDKEDKDLDPVLFFGNGLLWAYGVVLEAPAVELVRCKDCKHRVEGAKMCAHPKAIGWDAIEPEDEDFCSYGERKDNG